jgi:hypothetical protein
MITFRGYKAALKLTFRLLVLSLSHFCKFTNVRFAFSFLQSREEEEAAYAHGTQGVLNAL